MGPCARCRGTDVPPPRKFQPPLPGAPQDLPSYTKAKWAIGSVLNQDESYASWMVTLAYRCAATSRATDYMGGCNSGK